MTDALTQFRDTVDQICGKLPGATRATEAQGEIPSWKVGGKMFATLGHRFDHVSVKCTDVETAAMLIEAGIATKAKYFHRSWVTLHPSSTPEELTHRIQVSYDLIRSSLPKKHQATREEA